MSHLSSLIYHSERIDKTDNELDTILKKAVLNNSAKNITGILMYTETHFIQYLEGNIIFLNEIFEKISLDDRHKKVTVVGIKSIKERLFPKWSMGKKELNKDVAFSIKMNEKEKNLYNESINGGENSDNHLSNQIDQLLTDISALPKE